MRLTIHVSSDNDIDVHHGNDLIFYGSGMFDVIYVPKHYYIYNLAPVFRTMIRDRHIRFNNDIITIKLILGLVLL